jgi:hypothetical protein
MIRLTSQATLLSLLRSTLALRRPSLLAHALLLATTLQTLSTLCLLLGLPLLLLKSLLTSAITLRRLLSLLPSPTLAGLTQRSSALSSRTAGRLATHTLQTTHAATYSPTHASPCTVHAASHRSDSARQQSRTAACIRGKVRILLRLILVLPLRVLLTAELA